MGSTHRHGPLRTFPPPAEVTATKLAGAVSTYELPLGPGWRWKPRLRRDYFIRPNGRLLAILPLDGDRLMGCLEPAIIDRKVAQNGLGRKSQEHLTQLVGVQTSGLLQSFDQEPAAGVGGG